MFHGHPPRGLDVPYFKSIQNIKVVLLDLRQRPPPRGLSKLRELCSFLGNVGKVQSLGRQLAVQPGEHFTERKPGKEIRLLREDGKDLFEPGRIEPPHRLHPSQLLRQGIGKGKFRLIEEFREPAGCLDAWRMEGHLPFFRSPNEDFQESAPGPCPRHDGHHARHIEPAGAAEPLR